ncbi:MAG: OmpH family outer membrane protein [Runella sp.]
MKSKLTWAIAAFVVAIGLQTKAQQTNPKIGWTNVDYIISVLPESKKIENELQIQQQQIGKAIQDKQKELQDLYEAYQKNASKWSDIIRADKEKQIQTRGQELEEFQRSSQESLQRKQQQLLQPVLVKINTAIEAVGKENGYTYILNMDAGANSTPIILFAGSDDLNVSNLVLKKLGVNPEEIEKQQKAAADQALQQLQQPQQPQQTQQTQQKPAANPPASQSKPTTPTKKN